MDIEPIVSKQAADKLAVWMAVRDALEAAATPPAAEAAPPTPLEGAIGAAESAVVHADQVATAIIEAVLPGADSDFSHEAATVQTTWRPPTPQADVLHAHDVGLPSTPAAQTDLALPASLLVPAMLTGLRVEPAAGWAQLAAGTQWPTSRPDRERRRQPRDQRDGRDSPPHEDEAPAPAPRKEEHRAAPDAVLDPIADGQWCEALSTALRAALTARIVPQALLAAAEQWKRGRCVVLACPQGDDPEGGAWAFVLWPRVQARPAECSAIPELSLHGLQVEARLQWSASPRAGQWCHVRVIKEHHPRSGRQLVALDEGAPGRPPACEVQLGPVLARSLRWCEVRVRIQAAQRFWAALGTQWSVHVVVSAQPLLAPSAVGGDSSC